MIANSRSRHRRRRQRRARCRRQRPAARPARSRRLAFCRRASSATASESLRKTAGADGGQLRVMTGAEVVCVDGVDGVEAVVVRHAPTGRLSAVNASAFLSFDAQKQ